MMTSYLFLILFLVSLCFVVLVRTKSNGKYEIKITDIITCLIPAILWLIVTGQISELGVGDLQFKLKEAYKKPVSEEISPLVEGKEILTIGVDCNIYNDDILNTDTFPSYNTFKYLLILENCEDDKLGNSAPTFWGILLIEDYKKIFLSQDSKLDSSVFLNWIKLKKIEECKKTIPSFVPLNDAVNLKNSKLSTLEKMETLEKDYLPIIDGKNKFLGVISRDRLNSSFLIDIGEALNR